MKRNEIKAFPLERNGAPTGRLVIRDPREMAREYFGRVETLRQGSVDASGKIE
jgi:hypothetical protein